MSSGGPGSREQRSSPAEPALSRMLLVGALLAIVVIVGGAFIAFRPAHQAWQVIVGGCLASLLAVLIAYVLRLTVLRPVDKYQTERLVEGVSERIMEVVQGGNTQDSGVTCFARWNDVPWRDVLAGVHRLEFCVSYMDTWIILTTEPLLGILRGGGRIIAYLPEVTKANVSRIQERFPEYSPQLVAQKVSNTENKLRALAREAGSPHSAVEVRYTSRYIMHCLMRLDDKRVILSPFDHFRRGRIEGPAFLIDTNVLPHLGEWADKELRGFAEDTQGKQ
jgi:hypothetical protein